MEQYNKNHCTNTPSGSLPFCYSYIVKDSSNFKPQGCGTFSKRKLAGAWANTEVHAGQQPTKLFADTL